MGFREFRCSMLVYWSERRVQVLVYPKPFVQLVVKRLILRDRHLKLLVSSLRSNLVSPCCNAMDGRLTVVVRMTAVVNQSFLSSIHTLSGCQWRSLNAWSRTSEVPIARVYAEGHLISVLNFRYSWVYRVAHLGCRENRLLALRRLKLRISLVYGSKLVWVDSARI